MRCLTLRRKRVFAAGVLAFLAMCILAGLYDTFPGDAAAMKWLQSHRDGFLDDAAQIASMPGHRLAAALSVTFLVLALLASRRWMDALMFASILAPVLVNMALKEIIDRPRPDMTILISQPTSPGFPSGHAEYAALLFLLLFYLAGELVGPRWLRWPLRVVLLLAILAVGASRVYLGVHWPSDVLGGYLLGALWVWAVLWARKRLTFGSRRS